MYDTFVIHSFGELKGLPLLLAVAVDFFFLSLFADDSRHECDVDMKIKIRRIIQRGNAGAIAEENERAWWGMRVLLFGRFDFECQKLCPLSSTSAWISSIWIMHVQTLCASLGFVHFDFGVGTEKTDGSKRNQKLITAIRFAFEYYIMNSLPINWTATGFASAGDPRSCIVAFARHRFLIIIIIFSLLCFLLFLFSRSNLCRTNTKRMWIQLGGITTCWATMSRDENDTNK